MPADWFSRTLWAASVAAVQQAHCRGTGRRQACSPRPSSCHMPSSPPAWPRWARSSRRAGSKTARTHARRTCSWSRCTRVHCASFTEDHVSASRRAAYPIHSPSQPCDTGIPIPHTKQSCFHSQALCSSAHHTEQPSHWMPGSSPIAAFVWICAEADQGPLISLDLAGIMHSTFIHCHSDVEGWCMYTELS